MVQPLWSALDRCLSAYMGEGALLCVSGGPDSRTLLEACARWPGRFLGPVAVACVDHGLRVDARAEADSVVSRARALGFEAHAIALRVVATDEATLRHARYAALVARARADGLGALVVAHHRGDVAEGRLLSLLGEGGGALRSVSWVSGLRVLRPFLSLARAELALGRTALEVRGVLDDPERRSARARLRGEVLPWLARPALVEERAALDAVRRAEDEDTLLPMARELVDDSHRGPLTVRPGAPALVRRALRLALAALAPEGDVRASSPALDAAVRLFVDGRRGEIHLCGGVVAVVGPDGVRLETRALAGSPVPAYAAWDSAGDVEGTEDS